MNTIAFFALFLLASAVSAQRQGGSLIGNCPSYFCRTGQCGQFATFANYYGGQCRCPCFGFGGGNGGNIIRNCPRSFCYTGQCGNVAAYSQYQYYQCKCHCYGYSGNRGIIQN